MCYTRQEIYVLEAEDVLAELGLAIWQAAVGVADYLAIAGRFGH